jgi:PTH1 family peptidyl-tRNA hydrolase
MRRKAALKKRRPKHRRAKRLSQAIALLVGLGNPGADYVGTRHNAGEDFVTFVADKHRIALKEEPKFHGLTGRGIIHGHEVRLLIPKTFMNRSGKAVAAMASFYKIAPAQILVAYDELDFAPGTARFKLGGSSSQNGIKDIVACLGNVRDFHRLRIGIGHPGHASQVTGWVLGRAPKAERDAVLAVFEQADRALPYALAGDWAKAMNLLHQFSA